MEERQRERKRKRLSKIKDEVGVEVEDEKFVKRRKTPAITFSGGRRQDANRRRRGTASLLSANHHGSYRPRHMMSPDFEEPQYEIHILQVPYAKLESKRILQHYVSSLSLNQILLPSSSKQTQINYIQQHTPYLSALPDKHTYTRHL